MVAQRRSTLTYAEYLVRERVAEERHEYVNGEAFAMAGGTIEHGALAASVARVVGRALEAKPCRVFSADVRVRVAATGGSFYPDLSVVCGKLERALDDEEAVANPIALFEILSDGTEAYDRGAKAGHYRRLSSLREYVLINQTEPRIEVQRLNDKGTWELHFFGAGDVLKLASLGISVAVDDIYANPLG